MSIAGDDASADPLRERLLEAAARVFAREGYAGTRIMDIVREAGLSTGPVYGRFRSKNDLLRAAVVERARDVGVVAIRPNHRVADLLRRMAGRTGGALGDAEAVRLEAHVAARREPEVAQAIAESNAAWRTAVEPLLAVALADGTVDPALDPEAVLYLIRTLSLGLLLQRAAGTASPDPDAWAVLVERVIASFGDPTNGAGGELRKDLT